MHPTPQLTVNIKYRKLNVAKNSTNLDLTRSAVARIGRLGCTVQKLDRGFCVPQHATALAKDVLCVHVTMHREPRPRLTALSFRDCKQARLMQDTDCYIRVYI